MTLFKKKKIKELEEIQEKIRTAQARLYMNLYFIEEGIAEDSEDLIKCCVKVGELKHTIDVLKERERKLFIALH